MCQDTWCLVSERVPYWLPGLAHPGYLDYSCLHVQCVRWTWNDTTQLSVCYPPVFPFCPALVNWSVNLFTFIVCTVCALYVHINIYIYTVYLFKSEINIYAEVDGNCFWATFLYTGWRWTSLTNKMFLCTCTHIHIQWAFYVKHNTSSLFSKWTLR